MSTTAELLPPALATAIAAAAKCAPLQPAVQHKEKQKKDKSTKNDAIATDGKKRKSDNGADASAGEASAPAPKSSGKLDRQEKNRNRLKEELPKDAGEVPTTGGSWTVKGPKEGSIEINVTSGHFFIKTFFGEEKKGTYEKLKGKRNVVWGADIEASWENAKELAQWH